MNNGTHDNTRKKYISLNLLAVHLVLGPLKIGTSLANRDIRQHYLKPPIRRKYSIILL